MPCLALVFSLTGQRSWAASLDYHTDVAPILRDYCAGCHNNDELEGELSFETYRQLMKGGESGTPIVPGKATDSLLFKVLTGGTKPKMPPKKEPQLAVEQIAVIRNWINGGAKGPAAGADKSILSTLNIPKIAATKGVVRPVTAMDVAGNGRRAVARFGEVELTEKDGKTRAHLLGGLPGKVNGVRFSKDGTRLIAASGVTGLNGVAVVWDVATGRKLFELGEGHRDIMFDAEFSPDGKLIATAGYDRKIILWDAKEKKAIRTIDVHNGAIFDLAFNSDGTVLASASADETIKLWRVSDGERLDTLNQPLGEQYSVVFTPDDRFVIGAGADNRIRMWNLISRKQPTINPVRHARFAHEDDIVKIAISRDGHWLVSASSDRSIKLWSLPELRQVEVHDKQPDVATSLVFEPDGRAFVVGGMNGTVRTMSLAPIPSTPMAKAVVVGKSGVVSDMPETAPADATEIEPNDLPAKSQRVELPVRVSGIIARPGDADLFRFQAKAGEEWVLEIEAARKKSPLDSRIEVLDTDGNPIERVVLQALRDSWFTFRGKDSSTPDDFRVHNWREMELNEYLYANGEVVKLWLYPRGPDSGFKVYPGFGKRHNFFDTTALSHPLGAPCYIVQPFAAGSNLSANGLPVFRLYYENDDESQRQWGDDSKLTFTAPRDGEYLARVSDVRGQGGEKYMYSMTIRPRKPDFRVSIADKNPSVSPGSGKEITVKAERLDGFEGEIRVDVSGVPDGFSVTSPMVIEAGQFTAEALIFAEEKAKVPEKEAAKATKVTASAIVRGKTVTHDLGSLGEIKLGKPAKVLVEILPDGDSGKVKSEPGKPLEFTIEPGETITALVRAKRVDFKARIEVGKEDAGRNLPHGVYVDNIGLNGLLIVEGQTERQFFITAAKWVPDMTRYFFLRTTADGVQASRPAILHVRRPKKLAASEQ